MSTTLSELCRNLQDNTEKLEEEIKRNIVDCHQLLIDKKATQNKLGLEKAKDYHYKEVLDILKDIVNSIRKIIHHERKIRELDDEGNFTTDDLKRYSYVQRQVQAFSHSDDTEVVTKREKRRVASVVSVESLEAWELYLEKKEEQEKAIQVEKIPVPKRKTEGNRKKKKIISSTFNNFLDSKCENGGLESIIEDEPPNATDRLAEVDTGNFESFNGKGSKPNRCGRRLERVSGASLSSIYESDSEDESFKNALNEDEKSQRPNLSTLDIIESLNQELCLDATNDDTKPKIVDVVVSKF